MNFIWLFLKLICASWVSCKISPVYPNFHLVISQTNCDSCVSCKIYLHLVNSQTNCASWVSCKIFSVYPNLHLVISQTNCASWVSCKISLVYPNLHLVISQTNCDSCVSCKITRFTLTFIWLFLKRLFLKPQPDISETQLLVL